MSKLSIPYWVFVLPILFWLMSCSPPPKAEMNVDISDLVESKQYDRALAKIDDALAINPRHIGLLYNQAMVYRLQGNLQDALRAANKAQTYSKDDPDIKLLLTELALDMGDIELARQRYQTLPDSIRRTARAQLVAGLIYSYQNKWTEAAEALQSARTLNAKDPTLFAASAFVYIKLGKLKEGKAYLAQAERTPNKTFDLQRQIAECYLALGDAQKALSIAKPLSEERSEDARIWSLIGRIEMILLRFSEAESAFTRAQASPNATPWIQVDYAMMLFAAQREDEALSKAIAAEHQITMANQTIYNPALYNLLATLYARNNQWLLAQKYLNLSFQLDKTQTKVRELINKIANATTQNASVQTPPQPTVTPP